VSSGFAHTRRLLPSRFAASHSGCTANSAPPVSRKASACPLPQTSRPVGADGSGPFPPRRAEGWRDGPHREFGDFLEERAGVEEGILNSFGMGMQGAPLRKEVRLGFEAAGSFHAKVSLGQSKELCRGPASSRRGTGCYDAQSQEKRQSAMVGVREQDKGGRHDLLDSRAQFVGRQSSASSACLREEGIEERAKLEQVRDTKCGPTSPGQEKGIGDAQIGPLDGDAEHRSVGELQ
jgi:hypothetical protein